ncbi:MAG: phage holin family protein [Eubacteriaceae bacterium]
MARSIFLTGVATMGVFFLKAFGGWDTALQTLVFFMAGDYFSGILVAGVFKNSPKTSLGALSSGTAFQGLLRKGMVLFVVLIACQLDGVMGTDILRDATILAYCGNEALSITENVGLMGVPLPNVIKKAVEILKEKEEK